MAEDRFYATGKRKCSVARVWVTPGEGKITVNQREMEDYFPRETLRQLIFQPLQLLEAQGRYDITANVCGGGISGQAGAVRHGIAKALVEIDPGNRKSLKQAGFITRDPRCKERKKYGQRGARARFQFSKR